MRKSSSFKRRMIVSLWVLLVLMLLIPSWYFYRDLSREVHLEAQRSAVQKLDLVRWMMSRAEDFRNIQQLQQWLTEAGKSVGLRITYVAEGGQVIADSEIPFDKIAGMENFYTRPEILLARDQEVGMTIRLSRVEKKEYIYVASRVEPKGAIPAGIVRLAVPFSNMKDLLGQQRNSLFVGSVFIFLAMAFLSYALIRELSSPIRDMVQAIEAVGQKDFKQRIRFNPEHEFYPLAQAINQMAERVDKLILSISEQRQQLEVVFNRMQEGVMVLDPRGRIQSINRALSTLVSRTPRPIGRRPLEAFMNLELQEACDRVLAPTTDFDAAPCRLQIVLGGGERIYNVSIVRLQDIQKGMGALVVFHDITELRRLETVRQDFVANVSHELRSPITAIKGYTETLLSEAGHDADTAASFMRGILKNTNHMAKIVDDLLALAKLQALEEPIKPVSVNAAEALQAAWKACAPMAEAKAVSLQNDLPEGGIWISADFGQLVQVFRNLIENGVRYSPEGKALTVSCQVQGDRVTFGVRDEGPGIQKSHQQRIFERFYRVERQRNTDLGSTGLGLAICRHIIQNHGGRIWVQSPNSGETRGSTFYFSLSLSESAQAEAPGSQCG